MAAHALTIINEWSKGEQLDNAPHALAYAPGCDCLEFDDYCRLDEIKYFKNVLVGMATQMVLKYRKLWVELGKPDTAEEWKRARGY